MPGLRILCVLMPVHPRAKSYSFLEFHILLPGITLPKILHNGSSIHGSGRVKESLGVSLPDGGWVGWVGEGGIAGDGF